MENFKIYGNENTLLKLSSMIKRNKVASSILICGERGLGKTAMALYMAAAINCERGLGYPCGECKSCKTALHGTHPDIIKVKATSAQGNYRVKDDIRPMIADSYISPNESGRKIYIIDDGEKLNETCQNVLLKAFEEPPGESVFILAVRNKQSVLPTVLSRVIPFEMTPVKESECIKALTEKGISPDDAKTAQKAFPGNIGMQIEFLSGGDVAEQVELTRSIISALASADEYELLKAVSELNTRDKADSVAKLMCEVFSAAAEAASGAEVSGCCDEQGARALAKKLTSGKIAMLYDCATDFSAKVGAYANLTVMAAAFTANLANSIF